MHSNIEAIQIQRTYVEDGDVLTVHPTAVRKKIPFKKKVRERRSKHRNQNGHVKKRKSTVGASTDKSITKGHSNSNGGGSLWKRKKKELPKLEMTTTNNNNIAETKLESPLSSPNAEGPLLGTATAPEPIILNNLPSTSASAHQQQSQNQLSHDHEPKTAIVPHAKDANRYLNYKQLENPTFAYNMTS